MKHYIHGVPAFAAAFALSLSLATAAVVTFETVPLSPAGHWNGSDGSGGLTLEGARFNNNYNAEFGYWSGFVVSNHTDTTTEGYLNQYSAFTGAGAGGSEKYAVGYHSTYEAATTHVNFSALTDLTGKGAMITNTTYAALAMLNGIDAKKFGGATGNEEDWFLLTIEGLAGGIPTGSVDFYLADFRFADNSLDYVVDDWRFVNFSPLGNVDELRFSMTSTDNNQFGILTPSYFAMDNFLAVPEPSSLLAALMGLGLLARRRR